jgi:hypothetical protein
MNMKVKNSRPSMVTLPPAGEFGAKPLKPGVNLVSSRYLEQLKDHEGVEHLFHPDHGCLELVDEGEPYVPEDASKTLKGTNAANAIELVEACGSIAQLEQWMHADDRKTVQKAIFKRLEELQEEPTEES